MVIISSEPPRVPPEISGVPVGGLTSGEWLRVSCHLPWMNVKPSLEFWVNDRRARHMVSPGAGSQYCCVLKMPLILFPYKPKILRQCTCIIGIHIEWGLNMRDVSVKMTKVVSKGHRSGDK